MTVKITSPIEGYTDTTAFGPVTLSFKDGVAEVDKVSDGLKTYLKANGYKVSTVKAASAEKPHKPDGQPEAPEGSDAA